MKTARYTPHIFSLCALFVLSNALIVMPFYQSGGFWFVGISAVLSLALIFFINLLLKLSAKRKPMLYILSALVCAGAIYGGVTAFLDYLNFLKAVQLPRTSVLLLAAMLLAVVAVFSFCNTGAIYKYSFLVAILGGIMIALCLVGGLKNFDFGNFKLSFSKPRFYTKDFLRYFLPLAVLPFFAFSEHKNISVKPIFCGVAAGFLVLFICLAQCIFTLGAATDLSYPYLKAVSVISSGSLFTRLDGFVYFLFFVSALIKISVCVKTVVIACNKNVS